MQMVSNHSNDAPVLQQPQYHGMMPVHMVYSHSHDAAVLQPPQFHGRMPVQMVYPALPPELISAPAIQTAAPVASPPAQVPKANETTGVNSPTEGSVLKSLPKVLGAGFVLPMIYGLFCGPLFYASANPDTHVPRLKVLVASYDKGDLVGPQFLNFMENFGKSSHTSWVTNNGAMPTTLPGLDFVDSSVISADMLRQQVRDSQAWGAVFVNAGASERLTAALASPNNAGVYKNYEAITFVWDESRQPTVAAPRIMGPIKGLLNGFSTRMSVVVYSQNLARFGSSTGWNPQQLGALLASPVSFMEESLYPNIVAFITQALTIGQIVLVIAALIMANLMFGPLKETAFFKTATPGLDLASRRFGLTLWYTCLVGAVFATLTVGMAQQHNLRNLEQNLIAGVVTGNTNWHSLGGTEWVLLWLTQWLFTMIIALWLLFFATAADDAAACAPFLLPLIVFNVLSITVDISDPGFKFFWYAPMWHSAELIRFILSGSLSTSVGMHVGVNLGWLGLEILMFVGIHLKKAAQSLPN